jgi:hypothetical protein
MKEPRRLTTLRASTACYRDSFNLLLEHEGASTSDNPMDLHVLLQG